MTQPRRLALQLALTWCAIGYATNAITMSERAALGLPVFEPPLFWALLRWTLWLALVPPIVLLALRTRNVLVHVAAAVAASVAHTTLVGIAHVLAGRPFPPIDRFPLDFAHDTLIYAATVAATWADRFLNQRRANAIARSEAEARAVRNRLRPEEVSAALREISAMLPHDTERAEDRLDELASSLRERMAARGDAGSVTASAPASTSLLPLRLGLVAVAGLALGGISLAILGAVAATAAAFAFVDAMRALELEQRRAEAEERFLRARLEPHFLFNSLNSAAGLIEKDPALAREMLVKLHELYVEAFASHGAASTIAEELALIERYLFVESIRFRDRMNVSVECDPAAGGAEVLNLLLQPIVENAVRHGIARRTERGEIAIRITRERQMIHATVVNDVADDDDAEAGERQGLALTRSRLGTRYGSQARLDARRVAGKFHVEMEWPCAS